MGTVMGSQRKDDEFDQMRNYIIAARNRGTSRLPPEAKLSEVLEVSRGRLRTLLKRMESEGLIWRHVGKGTFIGRRQPSASSGPVAESVSLEQVIQARLALEPQLAAQAAMHANQADLKELEACLTRMKTERDMSEWKKGDDALHLAIARSSHNALLILLFETLKAEVAFHFEERILEVFDESSASDPKARTQSEHEAIVTAITRHDPVQAEKAMRDHILSVRSSLFGL